MPASIERVNPQGEALDGITDIMRITKTNGEQVDIDIGDYIKFRKDNGPVIYGRVFGFSIIGKPPSFSYSLRPNSFGPPITTTELDTLENLGKQKPQQMAGGRRANRRRTKRAQRKHRRYSRRN